ncbi:MAG TPA: lipopolysaccharide kinase InaA family protein [bacterium]|nr:lipopolysaccharide kinase InaA family protein [bacterium]
MELRPGRFVKKRVGGIVWELIPGTEESLLPLLEQLDQPFGGHDQRVFRDDPAGAKIYTLKTNRPGLAGELFIKVRHRRGLSRLWGGKSDPVVREWVMAEEHSRRGLPVAAHLARGIKRRALLPAEEYLIQESLTAYESFENFFKTTFRPDLPGVRPQDKRRVIRELAGLIRRMHDRGVSRKEIEPRNIMAAPRSGGGVKFVFVDLHRSSLRRRRATLSLPERVTELARFHQSFSPLFSQSYRIRFYREYFAPDNLPAEKFQGLVKRIIALSAELAVKEEPALARAVRARKAPYFWFESGPSRIYLRKPMYQNSLLEVVEKLGTAEDQSRARIKQVGGPPPLELVIRQCAPDYSLPLRARSAAGWAFLASAIMDHHGVAHYRVMAAIERKGSRGGSILSVVPGKGEYSLAEYLARRVADEFSGLPWDRGFLIRVARFVLNLHELGWHFADPSGDDVWVRYTEAGTHELILFNLYNLKRLDRRHGDAQLVSLFNLWRVLPLSQADGLMLAQEYLRFSRNLSTARKQWARRFMEWQMHSVSDRPEE